MINVKYKVVKAAPWEDEYDEHRDNWIVYKTYNLNWEDDNYIGDSSEQKDKLYSGSISGCNAFLNLYKNGNI
ncbi:MAG TPA: hypothetical protein VGK47_06175 [Nitrososphaeraceae archaeon]